MERWKGGKMEEWNEEMIERVKNGIKARMINHKGSFRLFNHSKLFYSKLKK